MSGNPPPAPGAAVRPCPNCSCALVNDAAGCPRCGLPTATADAPKVAPGPAVENPGLAKSGFVGWCDFMFTAPGDLAEFVFWLPFALPFFLVLSIPLALGGVVGYSAWGEVGAIAGVIGAAVLFVAVVAYREGHRPEPAAAPEPGPRPKKRTLPPGRGAGGV